jgi:hypothetical protein
MSSNIFLPWHEEFSKTSPGMQEYVKSLQDAFEQQMRASAPTASPPANATPRNLGPTPGSVLGDSLTEEPFTNVYPSANPTRTNSNSNRRERWTRGGFTSNVSFSHSRIHIDLVSAIRRWTHWRLRGCNLLKSRFCQCERCSNQTYFILTLVDLIYFLLC